MDNIKSTDIYDIVEHVESLKDKYIDENTETLAVGMYGYLGSQFSTMIQNNIMNVSEWGNEAFPTRAKFEKTIYSNAINSNISDINATPSTMDIEMAILKTDLDRAMEQSGYDSYIIDKDTMISMNDFIFKLEYDIRIVRTKKLNNDYIYTAMYVTGSGNDIMTKQYLSAPVIIRYSEEDYLTFSAKLKQMDKFIINRKFINNSGLDNKVIDVAFDDQLYKIEVNVIEPNGNKVYIKPLFEGESSTMEKYCYYYYINPTAIRLRFDRRSYIPSTNSEIIISVYTTKGEKGNFLCDKEILFDATYKSKIVHGLIIPKGKSYDGHNKKDIETLKRLIPIERSSRGILSNRKDIENLFNMELDSNIKLLDKRHNQIERMYYTYLLARDNRYNIIPTNTIDLEVMTNTFDNENKNRFVIPPNIPFLYRSTVAHPVTSSIDIKTLEQTGFVYMSPFIINVNKRPLLVSYYLNIINDLYDFNYLYNNIEGETQFITSKMEVYKNHIYDNSKYYITTTIKPTSLNGIYVNETDGTRTCRLKPVLIIDKNGFKYYVEGEVIEDTNVTSNDSSRNTYTVQFTLDTNNIINDDGIFISNMYQFGTDTKVDGYMPDKIKFEIDLFLTPLKGQVVPNNISGVIPNDSYKNLILVSRFSPTKDVHLYYDYTDVINSVITVSETGDEDKYVYKLKSVPVIKYSYMQNIQTCDEVMSYIDNKKQYVSRVTDMLENNFGIDFKFFNTYGPSKTFKIGRKKEKLNNVNISIKMGYRPKAGSNTALAEYLVDSTKYYIENMNNIEGLHISNLIRFLSDKYKNEVEFIEFIGINDYDSTYQYIEKDSKSIEIDTVPEFININSDKNGDPDIVFEVI